MNIDDVFTLNVLPEEGEKHKVVVVTVYVDTMVLVADEHKGSTSPYNLKKDELYYLQIKFIRDVLAAAQGDADWIFICGHHPVITDANPARNLPGFAALMRGLMQEFGVDAYVSGHEHVLSLFRDETGTEGTYIISGSSSKRNAPVTCRRPSCAFNSAKAGFVVHLLSKTEMHHIFIDSYGEVLFTHTQNAKPRERDDKREVLEQIDFLAYPHIRRVYIGPADQSIGSPYPYFAPYRYFFYGALTASACLLLAAALVWLLRSLRRRKREVASSFATRLPASPQTQEGLNNSPEHCREVFVVTGKVVEACAQSERQTDLRTAAHDGPCEDQPQKQEQANVETVSTSRVLNKSKCSLLQGKLRRNSSRQAHGERTEPAAFASFESQSLLRSTSIPRRYTDSWVRSDPPPIGDTTVKQGS